MSEAGVERARVMTWNLWWRFGPAWRDRQPLIVETLRRVAPDLVALQEVWGTASTSQAHELAAVLGYAAAFGEPSYPPAPVPVERPDQEGVTVGVGLLSRWPILDIRQVPLPARHRPLRPVSLVATVAHPAGPLHVIASSLEYEPAHDDDRIAQGQQLATLATDPAVNGAQPVVVLGDLNAAPGSPVLEPLDAKLTDAWRAGGGDPAAVTLPSNHPFASLDLEELIDQRIDHVYVRPGRPRQQVEVTSATLAGNPVDGTDPSDHRAVVCELAWPGSAS